MEYDSYDQVSFSKNKKSELEYHILTQRFIIFYRNKDYNLDEWMKYSEDGW